MTSDGHSMISPEVLARYARDAAAEVTTVRGARTQGAGVEVHVVIDFGRDIPEVGAEVQRRVAEYLGRMAGWTPAAVHVVVDDVRR
ncbi:MAG TPA: Asp23/Gls24 family envelope stress response protein [Gaiellaceae bacterium]